VNRTVREQRFTSGFVLTLKEKKVICFVLLAFMLGFVTKQYRDKELTPASPATKATANAKRRTVPNKKTREKEPAPERESGQ